MLLSKLLTFSLLSTLSSALPPTAAATTPTATVIIPLYIYPTSVSNWSVILTNMTANPTLKHLVVIDPANGPGLAPTPDANYEAAITALNTHPNAIPLCYVRTNYALQPYDTVITDITTCANWKNAAGYNLTMAGIFFDEAVYNYNDTTIPYMTNITNYARTTLGAGSGTIVYNPGQVVPTQWYALADYIIAFENAYSAYTTVILGYIGQAYLKQSLFLMYGFSGTAADQATTVNSIVTTGGVGGLFITDQGFNTAYNITSNLWGPFDAAMASA
ncbi:hypothetical protein B7494_g6980 [Chlorociboria aeruginascens]|nr:hypothetical protein B7494_g6980 [Chlorociboria aeruginascens]